MKRSIYAILAATTLCAMPALAGSPPPPPGGCSTTASFDNNVVTLILDHTPAISTITVSGVDPYLWDVDVVTKITHTRLQDLDMTLKSPAGTIVTLSTDNGGGLNNAFDGALWDDDADPDGPVPYSTNDGLVGDTDYAALAGAIPLAPEEALGAFIGEDPNGTWTLTIFDGNAFNTGSLNAWSLAITSIPAAPAAAPEASFESLGSAPLWDMSTLTWPITVSGADTYLCDVNLATRILHTFPSDLDIMLQSPSGTKVTISSDNGNTVDNAFNGTLWDDDASPGGQVPYSPGDGNGIATDHTYAVNTPALHLAPEEALAAFIGEDPNGTWYLMVFDDALGDTGSVEEWSLHITTCKAPDADGDGTADACEECPNDASKTAPGACGCGAPDADSDWDGTLDCHDGCPADASKAIAGACGCGVAETDSDGDGMPDCVDGCPSDAVKTAAGACGCGTPDTDSDGDGLSDCVDDNSADAQPDQTNAGPDAHEAGDVDSPEDMVGGAPCGLCGGGMGTMVPFVLGGYGVLRGRRGRRARVRVRDM